MHLGGNWSVNSQWWGLFRCDVPPPSLESFFTKLHPQATNVIIHPLSPGLGTVSKACFPGTHNCKIWVRNQDNKLAYQVCKSESKRMGGTLLYSWSFANLEWFQDPDAAVGVPIPASIMNMGHVWGQALGNSHQLAWMDGPWTKHSHGPSQNSWLWRIQGLNQMVDAELDMDEWNCGCDFIPWTLPSFIQCW